MTAAERKRLRGEAKTQEAAGQAAQAPQTAKPEQRASAKQPQGTDPVTTALDEGSEASADGGRILAQQEGESILQAPDGRLLYYNHKTGKTTEVVQDNTAQLIGAAGGAAAGAMIPKAFKVVKNFISPAAKKMEQKAIPIAEKKLESALKNQQIAKVADASFNIKQEQKVANAAENLNKVVWKDRLAKLIPAAIGAGAGAAGGAFIPDYEESYKKAPQDKTSAPKSYLKEEKPKSFIAKGL